MNVAEGNEEQNGVADNTCVTETVPPPGFQLIETVLPVEGPTIVPFTTFQL